MGNIVQYLEIRIELDYIQKAACVTPSTRQYNWQKLEFYAFIHFGMNTFTESEWGSGRESLSIFNPEQFNADQWVLAVKNAEMKAVILTCKHHDGFCLWPSSYTEHSIKNTPYKNGDGDLVKEVSEACVRHGLLFGIYLSPWDRNNVMYGDSDAYNKYFNNQLTELLTNYGKIFCCWFDGACGEGSNGKRQSYDWTRFYDTIRILQPDAVISVCGPDVRWCGNEAGDCRESEWSVVPSTLTDSERISALSQSEDTGNFIKKRLSSDRLDLGSRSILTQTDTLAWYPAEVNTSIRPNWFYRKEDDNKLRTLDELIYIYERSVGGNASLLLNIPPDKRGLIHEHDVKRLHEMGEYIRKTYSNNISAYATASADQVRYGHDVSNILTENENLFWMPEDFHEAAEITITFPNKVTFDHIVIMEHIQTGQRIEQFVLYTDEVSKDNQIYAGTTIGYKKICAFKKSTATKIILQILKSRVCPTISFIGVYDSWL